MERNNSRSAPAGIREVTGARLLAWVMNSNITVSPWLLMARNHYFQQQQYPEFVSSPIMSNRPLTLFLTLAHSKVGSKNACAITSETNTLMGSGRNECC